MLPKSKRSRRKKALAPDQIFCAGFRDGLAGHSPHPQFRNHASYLKGYTEGYGSTQLQSQDKDREQPKSPTPLISFFQWSDLESALHSIKRWEQDQERLGFGTVALGFHNGWWSVLISEDLYEAALPF